MNIIFRDPFDPVPMRCKSVFSSPKQPAPIVREPDPLPPPPDRSDTETQALAEEQRKRSPRGGRASTFLTAGGVTEGTSAVRFLGNSAAT